MKKPRAGESVGPPQQVEDFRGPAFIHRSAAYPWQLIILALLVAGLLLLAGWRASRWYEERLLADQRAQVEARLVPYGNALTSSINRRLALLDGLAAFVQTHPTEAELETDYATFAAGLHASAIGIRGLQVYGPAGPNHIYPRQGNEATAGRRLSDLINDTRPDVRADVQRTIETRRIALSAPYELRQGGLGLVGRLAVYRGETLWGVVVVVLDLPPILAEAGIAPELAGLQMALRDGAGGIISGPAAVFAAHPVSYRVTLPEGGWELAALPAGDWEAGIRDARRLFQAVMWILALLAAALTYLTVSREAQLAAAVRARTQELSAANQALEQEIVERRQAAEALRHKETLLRLTGEMGKIGGWEFDAKTLRGTWTDEVARIHGLDPAVETNVALGVSFYTSQSRATIEAAIQDTLATGKPYDLELELTTTQGEHKWVRTIGRPLFEAGQVVKVEGTFQDITDRKRAEEALRESSEFNQQIIISAQEGIIVYDRNLRYVMWNLFMEELSGVPAQEVLGKQPWEVFPFLREHAVFDALKLALIGETSTIPDTFYPAHLGNRAAWLARKTSPFHNALGEIVGVLVMVRDITERKQAEEALHRLNAELEQRVAERTVEISERVAEVERLNRAMTNLLEDLQAANRQATEAAQRLKQANSELETFTYSVSHDLKAPLRGIDGYSRLLLEDHSTSLDAEGQHFVRTLRKAAQQMSQLIDDLLAYSRLERRTMTAEPVNPQTIVDFLLSERRDEIQQRQVVVTVDLPSVTVLAEAEGLSQVLRNLLDNALKFTRARVTPHIEIGGRTTADTCILWVRDNGIGFDMKYHDRIFDIFQRLQRAEEYPGTGIGLAIVQKALHRMGGRAWAESEPGQGATFFLEIPRAA